MTLSYLNFIIIHLINFFKYVIFHHFSTVVYLNKHLSKDMLTFLYFSIILCEKSKEEDLLSDNLVDNDTKNEIESDSAEESESDSDDYQDKTLPKPLFIEHYIRRIFPSLVFSAVLGVVLFVMQFPLPFFHQFKKAATMGSGVYFATIHILNSFRIMPFFTWILGYLACGLAILYSIDPKISSIVLSFVGSYVFTYLGFLLLGFTSMIYFYIFLTKIFVGFIVLALFKINLHYVIIKSAVATFILALIVNLMTPVKVLSIHHGSGWRIVVSFQESVSRIFLMASYAGFLLLNLFYDRSTNKPLNEENEKEEEKK